MKSLCTRTSSAVESAQTGKAPDPRHQACLSQCGRVNYTPAGTLSAFARISWRSDVNSEIVLVATEATGRALRPEGSVVDTITTLSM